MELKSVSELQMAIFGSLFIGAELNWFCFADGCKCATSSDLQGRTLHIAQGRVCSHQSSDQVAKD